MSVSTAFALCLFGALALGTPLNSTTHITEDALPTVGDSGLTEGAIIAIVLCGIFVFILVLWILDCLLCGCGLCGFCCCCCGAEEIDEVV
ncbi:hypothetical protein EKO27_g10578 [Xylaria grammica]|uniref:Uncharacterized protein n=1 Tax=Xylaria grammica TaxID=363999 RepID=A0A439CQT0_9PEZI|nr:hypothetical protein EKO27_g10578 [Xylaria grammica]